MDTEALGLHKVPESEADKLACATSWVDLMNLVSEHVPELEKISLISHVIQCGYREYPKSKANEDALCLRFLNFLTKICGNKYSVPLTQLQTLSATYSIDPQDFFVFRNAGIPRKQRRALFRTRQGLVGNGPDQLQEGDKVCILFGGEVPIILRPEGDHYLLIGESYVHGVMGGEFMMEWENGRLDGTKEEEFKIH